MIIAALWRYGDWRHVATGCNALVHITNNISYRLLSVTDLPVLRYVQSHSSPELCSCTLAEIATKLNVCQNNVIEGCLTMSVNPERLFWVIADLTFHILLMTYTAADRVVVDFV